MKTYLLFFLITPLTLAQWDIGTSYKIKSEVPKNGVGINISRNLPFQGASFGVKVRAEVNLFRETAEVSIPEINEKKFLSEDYNLNLIGEYFFKSLSPYFGFGFGYGELNSGRQNSGSFILSLIAGTKFPVSEIINPYIEIQLFSYLTDFDSHEWGRSISKYQARGAIGINFSLSTLSN
jgi:hypothetical protein